MTEFRNKGLDVEEALSLSRTRASLASMALPLNYYKLMPPRLNRCNSQVLVAGFVPAPVPGEQMIVCVQGGLVELPEA